MNKAEKPKVVIIVGPTASGKTGLAIDIAKEFAGEVISADSRQVYRGLDVGTAKVTEDEMQGIPHHLIDVVDIDQVYNAVDFKRDALCIIHDTQTRNKLPIIAGGTFFYVDTLLGRITTPGVPPNENLRAELETLTVEQLAQRLKTLDPKRYSSIDRNNPRRLIRAIEIATALGHVPSTENDKYEVRPRTCPYKVLTIGIATEREELRARLRARAEDWLTGGLKEEVASLLKEGVSEARLQELGFEYQVGLELTRGELTNEEFIEKIIAKNWQYAKRQLMWLKRDQTIEWFTRENGVEIKQRVKEFLASPAEPTKK